MSGTHRASARGIAAGVTAGTLRAVEVLAAHVARHRAVHEGLNALVQTRHTEAAAEAAGIDAAPRGPLAGVPVSVKECYPVAGLRTTLGVPSRRDAVDTRDCDLVARLRAAGAIVVGKGNVPLAMYLHETDNPVWGRTLHPLRSDRSPGGSSGGDAALVAAGVVPVAFGNDLAGSVRQPAHACGIAALLPESAALGECGAFDTVPGLSLVRPRTGILAREVDDLALTFAAVTRRPAAVESPPRSIVWWDDAGPVPASPAIRRGVAEAVARLARQGVRTRRVDGALAREAAWVHLAILTADGGAAVRSLIRGSPRVAGVAKLVRLTGLPQRVRRPLARVAGWLGSRIESEGLLRTGPLDAAGRARLADAQAAVAARYRALVGDADAVVCPVSALPALPHGAAARLVVAAAPCFLANLLDLPAGSWPITTVGPDDEHRGRSRDRVLAAARRADAGSGGLPVGVQVVAGPDRGTPTVLATLAMLAAD